jgi:F-type H+-transporting ATPase subunit b
MSSKGRGVKHVKRFLIATLFCAAMLTAPRVLHAQAQPQGEEHVGGVAVETPADETTVWKGINFGLLAIGLGYLLGKTLPPFFRSRTADIQKDIVEAAAMRRDAEQRAAAIEQRVSALGADIEAFRTQSRAEMEQEAARIREETARLIEKVQRQAGSEIETAGKAARRELQAYAAKLALDLAEQRIRMRLDPPTASGLVQDFVRDLEMERSKN